jgi:hypothetical protein
MGRVGAIVDYWLANKQVVPTLDLLDQYLHTQKMSKRLLDLLEEYNENHADDLKRLEYPDLHFSLNQRTEDWRVWQANKALSHARQIVLGTAPAIKKVSPLCRVLMTCGPTSARRWQRTCAEESRKSPVIGRRMRTTLRRA